MTPWRRHLHRAQWWLFGLLATFAILMAIVSSATQLVVLPWLTNHPEWVGAKLAEVLHRPVAIDRLEARWERTGPLLNLTGVHLGAMPAAAAQAAAEQTLNLVSAGLKINFFAWVMPGASWTEIRLSGIELDLVRDARGEWHLRGLDTGNGAASNPNPDDSALFSLGTVVVREARLNIADEPNAKHFKLGADELRLVAHGDFLRALARVRNLENDSAPLNAVVEYDRGRRDGRAYLGGADVDLAAVLRNYPLAGLVVERGGGKLQVWAWLKAGEVSEVRAEVDLARLVLTTHTSIKLDDKHDFLPHVGIDSLAFGARWRREEDGFSADVADLKIVRQGEALAPAELHLRRRYPAGDHHATPEHTLGIGALDLGIVASAAMLVDTLPADLRRWLYAGNPTGELARATLRFVDAKDFDAAAQLDGLGAHAFGKIPGASGLAGLLFADQDAVTFDLPQHNAFAVLLPKVFREPLSFAEFHGSVSAYHADDAWRIETDALHFENTTPGRSYAGELRGAAEIFDAGGKPALDLAAVVSHADVAAAKRFWPLGVMSPHAIEWLDRALDAGQVTSGRAVFRGNLADWPFRNNAGRFEASADVADLRFRYLGDWPAIEHAHALVGFVNAGLHTDTDGGSLQGVKVGKASVDISDYGEGTLEISANAQGGGRDLLGFVKASPLGTEFAAPLLGVDVGGQGKVDFALRAPMKPIENFQIDGKVQLADADLADAKYDLKFDKASGLLRFNRSGFSADQLATTFKGKPAKFSLAVGGYVGEAKHAVEGKVDVRQPVNEVIDAYATSLAGYKKYLSGETNWTAQFSVDRDDAKDKTGSGQQMIVTSDLRGVGIDLPVPLKKSADAALPLKLVLGLPFIGASIDASLGDILNLRGRLPTPTAPFAANVIFGGEATGVLPKSGIAIGGAARTLDLSGWMSFAADDSGGGGGGDVLQGVDVRTSSLVAWDRDLGEAKVRVGLGADTVRVDLDGARIEGSLTVPKKNPRTGTIVADFKRLHWPESPEAPVNAAAVGDVRDDSLNPAAIPALRIDIGDFRLGKASYGAASVETRPIADGMSLDKVNSHSKDIDMKAHGTWLRQNGFHRSTFGIELKARDFGAMLDALGYGGKLAGGEISASIDASWAGTPAAFALNRINGGALRMKIADGRIPNLEPGAGRLAGLLNLAALPRRLAFDFGDLFNKGFSFDLAQGVFTLTDGYAYSDGFEVKSPTADMRIRGAIGLKTSEWNMRVEVTPHVGATVFMGGGALIGGPVGAAAGALVGGVLGKAINQATQSEYKVSGSWDKPEIVKLGSRRVEAQKPASEKAQPKS
ncbi:MAG: TIGR02099 family protein [Proteobacteria bacterium]|uniref:YhdP family protein n=1 Tax=Rudaea sp. TaxID=2136325 RepID=UPI0032207575|nr:TIGR02099 family protein [Pseudomonadota bacterium]